MRRGVVSIIIAALLILLVTSCSEPTTTATPPEPAFDTFYLAVGNSHYSSDSDESGFQDLPGANKSASIVADYLDQAGAIAGITLLSRSDRFVTRSDVMKALRDLLQKIKASKAGNPLLIFYFCGHGVSEGFAWSHFSIPGNFRTPEKNLNLDTMSQNAIYAGDVADLIEAQNVQGMLLLDSCYEGEQAQLPSSVISKQLAQNLTEIAKVLRHMNEFRGPTVAVFSTRPGTQVSMVANPLDTESPFSIGPLARRLTLSFQSAFKAKDPLSMGRLLQLFSIPSFDPSTNSILTLSQPDNASLALVKYPLSKVERSELRTGTGTARKKRVSVR